MTEKDFNTLVKEKLVENGSTISELAKELGISQPYLSDILNGNRRGEAQREKIKIILGISEWKGGDR